MTIFWPNPKKIPPRMKEKGANIQNGMLWHNRWKWTARICWWTIFWRTVLFRINFLLLRDGIRSCRRVGGEIPIAVLVCGRPLRCKPVTSHSFGARVECCYGCWCCWCSHCWGSCRNLAVRGKMNIPVPETFSWKYFCFVLFRVTMFSKMALSKI